MAGRAAISVALAAYAIRSMHLWANAQPLYQGARLAKRFLQDVARRRRRAIAGRAVTFVTASSLDPQQSQLRCLPPDL